jgi:hypothetical protein
VGLRDAVDDGQAEADARVVGAGPFGTPLKRLDQRGHQVCGELPAGVLDGEPHGPGADAGPDPDAALVGQVVDDRVVYEVRRQLQEQRGRAHGGGHLAGGLDGEAALLREREKRFGGLFREEGQVDRFPDEGPLIGAAEQEQRLGEVDRPGVDQVEALDEFAGVAVRVLAGHVEQGLRDRQRGA